jgi:hypothetical protein
MHIFDFGANGVRLNLDSPGGMYAPITLRMVHTEDGILLRIFFSSLAQTWYHDAMSLVDHYFARTLDGL